MAKLVETFDRLQIPYLVTGSVAAMACGEPRLTNDIDVVAEVEEKHIAGLLTAFPSGEFYLDEEAVRGAVRRRGQCNVIHPASGLQVNVVIAKGTEFDRSRFSRARRIRPAETYEARFAAPEDVVIKKMECYKEGGSEKHLRDIAGIMKISAEEIDQGYITEWADRLDLRTIWDAIALRLKEEGG